MLMKVAFPSTIELDGFIGQLQHFGKTQTQIVFSTPVEPRGLNVEALAIRVQLVPEMGVNVEA